MNASPREIPLTPPDGVPVYASDWITVSLVHPWYLRWLPATKLKLRVTKDGRLHVCASESEG